MNKIKRQTALAAAGLALGAGLLLAYVLLDLRWLSGSVSGVYMGLSGALMGVSLTGLVLGLRYLRAAPKRREALDLEERDERNAAIRDRASNASWYFTLVLLVGLTLALILLDLGWAALLGAGAVILHCAFLLAAICHYGKKM